MSEFAYEHDFSRNASNAPERPMTMEDIQAMQISALMDRMGSMDKQPPASPTAIADLEVIIMDNRLLNRYKDPCSICFCAYSIDEEVTKMPCKHGFHSDCILKWLDSHNTCPVCRHELPTMDPDYETRRLEKLGYLPKSEEQESISIMDLLMGRIPANSPATSQNPSRNSTGNSRPPSSMYS